LLCTRPERCDEIDAVTSNSLPNGQEPSSSSAQDSVSTSDSSSASNQDPSLVSTWTGYKLVKDNIDKNIRPSFQRQDHQTKSYHYTHAFAVKDRLNLSSHSDAKPDCSQVDPFCLLPNTSDLDSLKKNFVTLISRYMLLKNQYTFISYTIHIYRVLVEHMEVFSSRSTVAHTESVC